MHSNYEARFYTLGKNDSGKHLFIVFTVRNNLIRIISARDMNRKERDAYKYHEKIPKEYKEIAKTEGKTISGLFREMFFFYKKEKLKEEFFALQDYGVEKAKELNISEEEIERLIFAGR